MNRKALWVKWLSVIGLFWVCSTGNAAQLVFSEEGEVVKTVTLDEMKKQLSIHQVDIYDPHYGKDKRYLGFSLHDVMALAYGKAWEGKQTTDVNFIAQDGYQAVATFEKLIEQGGYIIYHDVDLPEWELIGHNQSNPGPFYLVWKGKKQTPKQAYPWPYQLAAINTVEFQRQYPAIYPNGVQTDSSVYNGFKLFKARCMKCHALDKQGGKVGPDLNAPKNIMAYRSSDMLREYIRQPSKFRYTQMPDHTDLSFDQIDRLLDYLDHQGKVSRK
ncbi:cytochrome c [uncultured Photobacterium sp.]|uniref:c-type cytochrome n=1 Tax=uncultured Photobacterium sp. TaxID=173973 RepID=UPI002631B3A8|nr:cytochrome c [uncultured Photobacterium sp.]